MYHKYILVTYKWSNYMKIESRRVLLKILDLIFTYQKLKWQE